MLHRSQSILLISLLGLCILTSIALAVQLAEERRDRRDIVGNYLQLLQKEFVGKPNGSLATSKLPSDDGVFKATGAYEDSIWLYAIGYKVWLGGEVVGQRRSDPPTDSYVRTTDSSVVAITDSLQNDFGWDDSYIHLDEHKMINFEVDGFGVKQTVDFKDASYTITSNVIADDTCQASWYEEEHRASDDSYESFAECDLTKPLRATSLLVNGKTAYRINPVALKRLGDGTEGPKMYQSDTGIIMRISMLGVAEKMDAAYFEFFGKNYSLNELGVISPVTLPDDLVKIERDEGYKPVIFPESD